MVCGGYNSFALDQHRNLYAWGNGNFGQTGTGSVDNIVNPILISPGGTGSKVKQLSAGFSHVVALTELVRPLHTIYYASIITYLIMFQGLVYTWGRGKEGQLGIQTKPFVKL